MQPVPPRLRRLEPVASIALAAHALAVLLVGSVNHEVPICLAIVVLVALGCAGLAGMRSTCAITVRCAAILVIGYLLQVVKADDEGYFLLWFFVLVSVYPPVLPDLASRWLGPVTAGAYLTLAPISAVDGSEGMAPVRAVSLAFIAVTVHKAAQAYRETVGQLSRSQATAQEALTTLQEALLPPQVTSRDWVGVAGRYQAAGMYDQIGGDWYDTIGLPADGLALVIGDVEGHDLTAASVMGLVRGAVRGYALEGHPPSIVLDRVNEFMLSAGIERLVTMAYVQLYPDDRTATVALAGHPAPLVVPAGPDLPYVLDTEHGPVLGVAGLGQWEERTVQLPRDASLVLYTDGLAGFTEYPLEQAERAIAGTDPTAVTDPERLADVLIATAEGHDDAAVLVAKVRVAYSPPAQRTFPAQPVSASIARTWIADLFVLWLRDGTIVADDNTMDHLEAAQLMLTELVSNAVRHSDESVTVQLEVLGTDLRVEVTDSSERMPVMRPSEDTQTEGRGLRLVDALCRAWGVRLEGNGKVVWFEIGLDGTTGAADEEAILAAFAEPGI